MIARYARFTLFATYAIVSIVMAFPIAVAIHLWRIGKDMEEKLCRFADDWAERHDIP